MGKRIQIDIIGPQPNEVDIGDLARVLEDLSRAISACLESEDRKSYEDDRAKASLVDIVEGSDGLVLEVRPAAARALSMISRTISRRAFNELPRDAHEALFRVNQFTSRRRWGVRVRPNRDLRIVHAEMTTANVVPPLSSRTTLRGGTSLLARCLRVGGATQPRAELRLANGTLLHVDVTEAIARELGKRLYDEVVLSGSACWDAKSGELKEFKVAAISTFRSVPPTMAFKELAEASRGRWDDVDAESFVRGLRENSS